MDTEGEGEGETNWESGGGSYTLLCVKWTASGKLSQCREPSSVLGDDLQGGVGWVGERFMREWKFKKKKRFHFPVVCCRCRGIRWICECGSFIL